jgi:hypothetical protein
MRLSKRKKVSRSMSIDIPPAADHQKTANTRCKRDRSAICDFSSIIVVEGAVRFHNIHSDYLGSESSRQYVSPRFESNRQLSQIRTA